MKLTATLALWGLLAVAFGAFGAHGLDGRLGAEALSWWETATFYLLVHAALGTALSLHERKWRGPAILFAIGAPVFAGPLYVMALGGPSWLGAVTPVGGLLMLAGWLSLIVAALRQPGRPSTSSMP